MKCWKCGNEVTPVRSKFNWAVFVVLTILGIVLGIVYLIYHFSKQPRNCPACNTDLYPRFRCPHCGKSNLARGTNPCPKCSKQINWT